MGRIIVHADDFGLSPSITNDIFECYQKGILHRTSLLVNGTAYEQACNLLKKNQEFQFCVHLNLTEGKALSHDQDIDCLIDEEGDFSNPFENLFRISLFGTRREKNQWGRQIYSELKKQMQKIQMDFGLNNLCLDSHQHVHMIPLVFDVILALAKEFNIEMIRIPLERVFFFKRGYRSNFFSLSMMKVVILKVLSHARRKELQRFNIDSNAEFSGFFLSGERNWTVVKKIVEI